MKPKKTFEITVNATGEVVDTIESNDILLDIQTWYYQNKSSIDTHHYRLKVQA